MRRRWALFMGSKEDLTVGPLGHPTIVSLYAKNIKFSTKNNKAKNITKKRTQNPEDKKIY